MADVSFAIDIAAQMPEGEATLTQLDALTAKLMGGGKNADHFQRAIQQVSNQLGAAKAAAEAANATLEAGNAEYRQLERAALQASKAAEKAGRSNAGAIPPELAAKAAQASLALEHHAGALAQLEARAKSADAAEAQLGRTLDNVKKLNAHANTSLAQQSERLGKLRGAIGNVGGPLGALGQSVLGPVQGFRELSATMGTMGAAATLATVGVVALAAALLAAGAAAIYGGLKIAKWAVMLSDKFGGVTFVAERVQKNFLGLFSGLNVDPVIDALNAMADAFDETSEIGGTIKFLFETIFQPLIDQAENAYRVVEAFVIGFLIGLLKMYIAAKPTIKALSEFFGFENPTLEDTLKMVTKAGEYAAGVFVALVVVLGGLAAIVAGLIAAFVALNVAIFAIGTTVLTAVIGAFKSAIDWVRSINLAELGANILRGLAAGITGAAGAVVDAMRNAVNAAIKAAKSALGIASPSKVFEGLGAFTGEGFERGVESAAPDAQSAMANMVSPLAAQDAIAQAPAAAPSKASPSVSVQGTFNFYGVKDAEHAQQSWGEVLTRILEGDVATLGHADAPA